LKIKLRYFLIPLPALRLARYVQLLSANFPKIGTIEFFPNASPFNPAALGVGPRREGALIQGYLHFKMVEHPGMERRFEDLVPRPKNACLISENHESPVVTLRLSALVPY
jgi:hypothetical protein